MSSWYTIGNKYEGFYDVSIVWDESFGATGFFVDFVPENCPFDDEQVEMMLIEQWEKEQAENRFDPDYDAWSDALYDDALALQEVFWNTKP